MSTINQQLLTLFEEYKENSDKFAEKGKTNGWHKS